MLTESFPLCVSVIAQGTLYLKIDYIMILKYQTYYFWWFFHFLFLFLFFCLFQPRSHNNLQCYTLRVSTEGLNDIYREIKSTRYLPKTFHLSPLPTPPHADSFSFSLSLSYSLSFPFIFPTLCLITRNLLLVSNVLPKLGKHTSPLKLIVCLGYIIHLVVAPAGSSGKLALRWS